MSSYYFIIIFIFLIMLFVGPIYGQKCKKEYSENYSIVQKNEEIAEFIIYYGEINEEIVNRLKKYKLIIIEPKNIKLSDVLSLKESGVTVIGYLSVIEQNENDISFSALRDEWFYRPKGQKIRNNKWSSWYMDIRNIKYQNFLLEQLYLNIVDKKMDGVLLDTVGDIDDLDWSDKDKKSMRKSYRSFLQRIRTNFEDTYIIQNWGFKTAKENSNDLIDGIMWEGFRFELLKTDEWSKDRFEEIKDMNIDFYFVTSKREEVRGEYLNKNIYRYIRDTDIYDDF